MSANLPMLAADQQKRPFKPIPKPRKSLMMNNNINSAVPAPAVLLASHQPTNSLNSSPTANTTFVAFPLTTADNTKGGQHCCSLLTLSPPAPAIPPRNSFSSRPLPSIPQRIIQAKSGMAATGSGKDKQQIYPILEDDDLFFKPKSSPAALIMDIAPSSSTSEFSSSADDYHSLPPDSPGGTTADSSHSNGNAYHSFFEPLENPKSDGESVCYSGWVQLTQGIIRHKKRGWALLRRSQFTITQNEENESPLFGPIEMERCVYMSKHSGNGNANDLVEELIIAFRETQNGKQSKPLSEDSLVSLRFRPEENAHFWLALLAKSFLPWNVWLDDSLSLLDCCGRLWIKRGVSGLWNEGWAFVYKRMLHCWVQTPNPVLEIDIRKVVLIKRKDIAISDWCNKIEHSSTGPILISLEGNSLYLQSVYDKCTTLWFDHLSAELGREANLLEECRLTTDDVPVIVDKCIRLISTYGMNLPGIYRKSGSAAEARRIMQSFREDPFSVHLKSPITDETIFAVADVLRQFFRQLHDPLIPTRIHLQLYEISDFLAEAKPRAFRELLGSLPKVHYRTLKKLLGHLQEIITHEGRNLASLDNISKVFGPTIFSAFNSDQQQLSAESYSTATKQAIVLRDLVFHYCEIFNVSADELIARDKLDILQDQKSSKSPASGLLIPVHLFQRDNKCFNVQSEWTAAQVVSFKLNKLAFVSSCERYALFEMLRGGQLQRRIEGNETLLSIVLGRWLDWDEHRDNFLLLKKDSNPFQPESVRAFAEDIKLAEPGSRSFKSAALRIEAGTHVCQYSKSVKRQNEWKLDEMLWFLGSETDRKSPHPYALTFFATGDKKAAKCKGRFPGYCVAFKDEMQRLQWLNQVIMSTAEYLPQPIIQI